VAQLTDGGEDGTEAEAADSLRDDLDDEIAF
jgi:hypothetical protein